MVANNDRLEVPPPSGRTGLVLAGGGARAAYQVGVLRAIAHLLPKDARPRIAVKRWEALSDGVCDAAALVFLERKRPDSKQDPIWIKRQLNKVEAGLKMMSDDLGQQNWCTGEFFCLADIAVGCALGYLEFRFPEIDWRRQHPNLSELFDRLMQRPAFKETVPVA